MSKAINLKNRPHSKDVFLYLSKHVLQHVSKPQNIFDETSSGNRHAYIPYLPEKVHIQKGEEHVLLTNTLNTSSIILEEQATLTFIAFLTEGWEEVKKIHFHLRGKESKVNCFILIIGRNDQKYRFETISYHETKNTKASYNVRNALFDKATVDYKGNLKILPAAKLSDCYLNHHSLLLSSHAKVYSIPSLEIEADDVKAGHAATVGTVDDEMLFYLQSRGLDTHTAKEMLIQGFFEADIEKIPSEEIKMQLKDECIRYLHVRF